MDSCLCSFMDTSDDLCNLWIVRLILNFGTLVVQVNMKPGAKDRVQTYLSYILEVQPKKWIPVALIEGVVCHEITCNLTSVRNVALRHKHVHGSHWSIQPDVWFENSLTLATCITCGTVFYVNICRSVCLYNVRRNRLISDSSRYWILRQTLGEKVDEECNMRWRRGCFCRLADL